MILLLHQKRRRGSSHLISSFFSSLSSSQFLSSSSSSSFSSPSLLLSHPTNFCCYRQVALFSLLPRVYVPIKKENPPNVEKHHDRKEIIDKHYRYGKSEQQEQKQQQPPFKKITQPRRRQTISSLPESPPKHEKPFDELSHLLGEFRRAILTSPVESENILQKLIKLPTFTIKSSFYNSIIFSYSSFGNYQAAERIISEMVQAKVAPDIHSYVGLLKCYSNSKITNFNSRIIDNILSLYQNENNNFSKSFHLNLIIQVCHQAGRLKDAVEIFESSRQHLDLNPTTLVPIYCSLVNGCLSSPSSHNEALHYFFKAISISSSSSIPFKFYEHFMLKISQFDSSSSPSSPSSSSSSPPLPPQQILEILQTIISHGFHPKITVITHIVKYFLQFHSFTSTLTLPLIQEFISQLITLLSESPSSHSNPTHHKLQVIYHAIVDYFKTTQQHDLLNEFMESILLSSSSLSPGTVTSTATAAATSSHSHGHSHGHGHGSEYQTSPETSLLFKWIQFWFDYQKEYPNKETILSHIRDLLHKTGHLNYDFEYLYFMNSFPLNLNPHHRSNPENKLTTKLLINQQLREKEYELDELLRKYKLQHNCPISAFNLMLGYYLQSEQYYSGLYFVNKMKTAASTSSPPHGNKHYSSPSSSSPVASHLSSSSPSPTHLSPTHLSSSLQSSSHLSSSQQSTPHHHHPPLITPHYNQISYQLLLTLYFNLNDLSQFHSCLEEIIERKILLPSLVYFHFLEQFLQIYSIAETEQFFQKIQQTKTILNDQFYFLLIQSYCQLHQPYEADRVLMDLIQFNQQMIRKNQSNNNDNSGSGSGGGGSGGSGGVNKNPIHIQCFIPLFNYYFKNNYVELKDFKKVENLLELYLQHTIPPIPPPPTQTTATPTTTTTTTTGSEVSPSLNPTTTLPWKPTLITEDNNKTLLHSNSNNNNNELFFDQLLAINFISSYFHYEKFSEIDSFIETMRSFHRLINERELYSLLSSQFKAISTNHSNRQKFQELSLKYQKLATVVTTKSTKTKSKSQTRTKVMKRHVKE